MIQIAVSTHWLSASHTDGSQLADAINQVGFTSVELGYDTLSHLVPGLVSAIQDNRIQCKSIHNFCPVPDGFEQGHPELFSLASLEPDDRQSAVYHTKKSIEFAARIGAEVVVSHAGNIAMRRFTEKLIKQYERGHLETPRYDRLRIKAATARKTPAKIHFNALCLSVEELLPELENHNVKLAFENLPSVEAMMTIHEQIELFEKFPSKHLTYWHDFGHAQVLQHLRMEPHFLRLKRFKERTAGFHIHDTSGPYDAHIMPPAENGIHWELTRELIQPNCAMILEPAPGTNAAAVKKAKSYLEQVWQD
jgi:sugar phosphate isomerase/epimerase